MHWMNPIHVQLGDAIDYLPDRKLVGKNAGSTI
jgi:hypothetical protein